MSDGEYMIFLGDRGAGHSTRVFAMIGDGCEQSGDDTAAITFDTDDLARIEEAAGLMAEQLAAPAVFPAEPELEAA